jgi:hypothetical protein
MNRDDRRAHLSGFESTDECFLIYHASSCRINQYGTILHLSKLFFPERSLGLLVQGQVQTDHVALFEKFFLALDIGTGEIGFLLERVPVMVDHLHSQSGAHLSDDLSDPTHPDDSQNLALGIMSGFQTGLPFPRPGVEFCSVVLSQRGDDQVKSGSGGSIVHGTGGVGDLDPAGRGLSDINLIVPCSVVADVFHRGGEFGDEFRIEYPDGVCGIVVSVVERKRYLR